MSPLRKSWVAAIAPMPIERTCDRLIRAKSGCAESAVNIVGGPIRNVAPRSMASSDCSTENDLRMRAVPAENSVAIHPVAMLMWKKGEKNSSTSLTIRPPFSVQAASHR